MSFRRALALGCSLALLGCCSSTALASAKKKFTAANWDSSAQHLTVSAGVMSEASPGNFNGAAKLTPQAEQQALAALVARQEADRTESEATPTPAPAVAVSSTAAITLTRFDALLVDQLGLAATAA
ncbi:MAG: hypothetical protein ACRDK2_04315, partial [Solirubrobacteraceae bacterium]